MDSFIYKEPEKLLQKLLRFDTTNALKNEKECCMYIKSLLDDAGIETAIYAKDENRPNIWAAIRSDQPVKPPVLLYGHADVVSVDNQEWLTDPFAGDIKDGCIVGRGAVDMKGELAMFIAAMLRIKHERIALDYDLYLLILCDEEDTGEFGSKYVVDNYPELFQGITCAIGEIGGFSMYMGGKKFYPIMIAEKQAAHIRITFLGPGGHGSVKHGDTSMTKMGRAVTALSNHRLKTRITPSVSLMIKEISRGLGGISGVVLKLLLRPYLTNMVIDLLKDDGKLFDILLHNSLNVTIVHGGTEINVIPGKVSIEADFRILPGCAITSALDDVRDLLREKAGLAAVDYEIEVLEYDENNVEANPVHFDSMKNTLVEMDHEGIPVPFVLSAVTDGRVLARAGVQSYGFTPMLLPEDYDFTSQAHNADEKIPLGAVPFGVEALILFFTKYYMGGAKA